MMLIDVVTTVAALWRQKTVRLMVRNALTDIAYTPRGHIFGFMIESIYSRARRGNRRIAGYVTVSATPLADKMAVQKTKNVTARSISTSKPDHVPILSGKH
jgi:hypothetical protein